MNNFDSFFYTPILRWKGAERRALRNLIEWGEDISKLVPLIELIPKDYPNISSVSLAELLLQQQATVDQILRFWGTSKLYVDSWLLPEELKERYPAFMVNLLTMARASGASVLPVCWLNEPEDHLRNTIDYVKANKLDFALRLNSSNLSSGAWENEVEDFITIRGIEPGKANLLIDFGFIEAPYPRLDRTLSALPFSGAWQSITFSSGAFPRNLTGFRPGQHLLRRHDWHSWADQLHLRESLPYFPRYSDYTIQHANYAEPPSRANFSASIRYAHFDDWVIMRGEGVFTEGSAGFRQWPANAQLLIGRPEFLGNTYSWGDSYIDNMANQLDEFSKFHPPPKWDYLQHLIYISITHDENHVV